MGRKQGKWELIEPGDLRAFRMERGLTRAQLAELVGVSSTSINNWESGRVASFRIQQRLRALVRGEPFPEEVWGPGGASWMHAHGLGAEGGDREGLRGDAAVLVTGQIVAAYLDGLDGRGPLEPEQLSTLIRSVREALVPDGED